MNKKSDIYGGIDPVHQSRWYAIYTKPRHEKKVFDSLNQKKIEAFLPLKKEYHQWSDRTKLVEEPLIRSYIFVHIPLKRSLEVLETYGVIKFVTFKGNYAPIPDFQIEALKKTLENQVSLEPIQYLKVGQLVEITDGPLKGVIGRIQRIKNEDKFVISLDAIRAAFVVDIHPGYLRPISEEKKKKLLTLPLGLEPWQ
ncbi:MAG: antitermination protein NusG [Candidatus Neomarinimicrobiota bacterium]|nr:UpxY family transcription antiterminator [Candidatus Neomarinimicrobiota bacterium]RKY50864.1 MAG: antitermination protein NusG [Candidatus Neomarinimicrobiota bacterium]HDN58843.1 UpxY family transcription antiterminator [Candidatus Neomarinimicrobiota bacterium]